MRLKVGDRVLIDNEPYIFIRNTIINTKDIYSDKIKRYYIFNSEIDGGRIVYTTDLSNVRLFKKYNIENIFGDNYV